MPGNPVTLVGIGGRGEIISVPTFVCLYIWRPLTRILYFYCSGYKAEADYPLGRIGSCLRPGMVRRPIISGSRGGSDCPGGYLSRESDCLKGMNVLPSLFHAVWPLYRTVILYATERGQYIFRNGTARTELPEHVGQLQI